MKAFEEAIGKAEATNIKAKSKAKEVKDKGKIEARLDFLAKMYEAEKTKQAEEKKVVEDAEELEE